MNRRIAVSIGAIVILLTCGPAFAQPARGAKNLDVKIDLSQTMGVDAEKILRPGLTGYGDDAIPGFVWDKTLSELRVGYVLIEPKFQIILPSTSLQDMKARMKIQDKLVMDVVRKGGKVLYLFQSIPRWISSRPKDERKLGPGDKYWYSVPPNDYAKWQEVVRAFVNHFNKELNTGGSVIYLIGSEPDNYWAGEEYDFYKYYEYAVKGALQADPNARIGGITPAHHLSSVFNTTGKPTRDHRPMLQNWIAYCAQAHLPIHFVTWHSYPAGSPVPRGTTTWNAAANDIGGWLRESGYKDTELIVIDWPEWRPHEECDTQVKAAWVASGVMSLADSRISMTHLLQDTQMNEQLAKSNGSFGGGNGLFTKAGVAKPVYNVLAAISRMQGQILKVDTGDPLVTGMATYGNGNLSVLLSYFLPPDWLVAFNLFEPGTDLASILEEGARAPKGVFENTLKRSAQGQPGTIPATFSSATKTYLQNVAQFARAAQARRGVPADIRLAVQGMADAAWTSQDFLVDGPGSDSFSQRKDIQAKLSAYMRPGANLRSAQPIIGQINSATGLRPGETRQVQAQTSRLTLTTRLNPYEVRLIVLNQGNQAPAVASQQ